MSANTIRLSAALLVALPLTLSQAAQAAPAARPETIKYSAEVKLLSDGIYRGVSQTEGRPQYIVGGQAAYGKFFAGVLYKSMRDRTTGVDNQTQAILGYKTNLAGNDIVARAIYKQYNGTKAGIDNEWMEYEFTATRKLTKRLSGKLNFAYADDNYGKAKTATYTDLGLDYKVTPKLSFQVANGFRHNRHSVDYTSYLAGVSYAVTPKFMASLTFTTTDKGDLGDKYGESTFITLSKKF
ncbi:porin [Asticcacaulis sp. DW145]|uniref:TorF family putative porin n=1 Tax=unclassified Asticcacaulis TaxID=2628350 RepID=UPI0030869018|nr:porin [Asticcacaulis sp. DW145]